MKVAMETEDSAQVPVLDVTGTSKPWRPSQRPLLGRSNSLRGLQESRNLHLWSLVGISRFHIQDMAGLVATLSWRSQRIVCTLLDHWRCCLTGEECHLMGDYSRGLITPNPDNQVPSFFISSSPERQSGQSLKDTTDRKFRF